MDLDSRSVISLSSDSDEPSAVMTTDSEVIPEARISPSKRIPVHSFSSSDDSDVESVRQVVDLLDKERVENVDGILRNTFPTFDRDDEDDDNAYAMAIKKLKPNKKTASQKNKEEKLKNKEEKLKNKEEKMKERERRKLEQAQEKALKKAAAEAQKMKKPGECLKYICVLLDQKLLKNLYGGHILLALKNAEIQYEIQQHVCENTIMWVKTVKEHNCDEDLKVTVTSSQKDEDIVLIVMLWREVIELIETNKLVVHIQNILSLNLDKKLTLVIYGLGEYYRMQSLDKKRHFKSRVQSSSGNLEKSDHVKVSKYDIETALLEIQLLKMCSHRLVESSEELGALVVNFTKALAERPFKQERQMKEQEKLEWFAAGDSRDTVKVDKNGNGLMRLWKQQLCQFNAASLDTAEAIVSVYPSPKSLFQAYEKCATEKEAEGLLQDIPVRRGAGVLTSVRRIGPELSKKIHDFFSPLASNIPVSQE